MGAIASQITSLTIVYSTVYSGADKRKHQSSASLAFVRGIHRGPVNSPHKWPVARKMFPLDAGNSPGTGEFPAQMASSAENVSIRWRHHGFEGTFVGNVIIHSAYVTIIPHVFLVQYIFI